MADETKKTTDNKPAVAAAKPAAEAPSAEAPNLTRDSIEETLKGRLMAAGKSEADASAEAKKRAREMVA